VHASPDGADGAATADPRRWELLELESRLQRGRSATHNHITIRYVKITDKYWIFISYISYWVGFSPAHL